MNIYIPTTWLLCWLSGKESACQCRRHGFNPRVQKIPQRRNGNLSSTLAWEIPWTEVPGRLQSVESQELEMALQLNYHYQIFYRPHRDENIHQKQRATWRHQCTRELSGIALLTQIESNAKELGLSNHIIKIVHYMYVIKRRMVK